MIMQLTIKLLSECPSKPHTYCEVLLKTCTSLQQKCSPADDIFIDVSVIHSNLKSPINMYRDIGHLFMSIH